jgi:hypothetical protein
MLFLSLLTTLSVSRPFSVYDRMVDEYGAVAGMTIGRRNRTTRRKSAPVPLWALQIPHDLTWDGTLAAEVGRRRLTV